MSFGKRRHERPSRVVMEAPVEEASAPITRRPRGDVGAVTTSDQGSGGGGMAMMAAAFVGVLAIGGGAAFLFDSGGASSAVAAVPLSGATHAEIAHQCRVYAGRDHKIDPFEEQFFGMKGVVRSPQFLDCLLSTETSRLCHKPVRAAAIEDLGKYLRFMRAKQRQFDQIMANPMARQHAQMMVAIEQQLKGQGEDVALDVAASRPEIDKGVVEKIKELIRDGYISGGDFGLPTPAYVEPYVEGVRRAKTSC